MKHSLYILILLFYSDIIIADEITDIRHIYNSVNNNIEKNTYNSYFLCEEKDNMEYKWNLYLPRSNKNKCDPNGLDAQVYHDQKHIKKVRIIGKSESGDWGVKKDFYYYDNGNLAFIFSEIITLLGYDYDKDIVLVNIPYVIEKRSYYSKKGNLIKVLTKAYSRPTGKNVPIKYLKVVDIEDYLNVTSLPFYDKLKK